MKFGVAITSELDVQNAIEQLCREAAMPLEGSSVDLALLFISQHYAGKFEWISQAIREKLCPRVLLGSTNAGIIGGEKEIENRPGITLWLANLPRVEITPFHLHFNNQEQALEGWPEKMPLQNETPAFLFIPDPFSVPADEALAQINQDFPGAPVFGGMASGGMSPGENRLFYNDEILEEGGIGAILTGNIAVRTVVSQGCRPVGKSFIVTQCEKNIVQTLGGKPALQQLQELVTSLPPEDQKLLRRGLHIGIAVDEMKENFRRGDFIVRNVMGIDPESGAIAIGDYVRRGQTVQFHVRDAESAREDLKAMLAQEKAESTKTPSGALLFSCNGRGTHLFGAPNHDVEALRDIIGPLPLAGFFAAGEIGPIGGKNFLHGFTASIALFCEPK